MKTIVTFIFVLFIGVAAQAQEPNETFNDGTVKMTVTTQATKENISFEKMPEVARLYKRSNAKIKKELSFSTKKDRPKMA